MKQYKLANVITGWIIFAIASVVYLLTIEPTASFWDCSEFISTAYKMEVGHPPGAPFFMYMARFFSLFASDASHVARMVNSLSALASGFTIMFLFWSITHLARKLIIRNSEYSLEKTILVLGSGIVGALAYTFSDSFWFSAVEAEVYASSSLFTAMVFWAILRWEDVADETYANRWLILIAYLMGLSIGVHLLNILAIPAMVFVYYFRKFQVTKRGLLVASVLSVALVAGVMYGVISGVIIIASKFELLFVNGFGLPFQSGIIFYILLLFGLIIWGLYYSHRKHKAILETILLAFTVMIIGYTSFAMIVIRAGVDPPINEDNPDHVFAMLSYLNREQYGETPLLYGEYYNAPVEEIKNGSPVYIQKGGKYVATYPSEDLKYDSRFMTIFPRMYSQQSSHISAYKEWAKIEGIPLEITNNKGEKEIVYKPTFMENLKYFFSYQVGFMYFRYFMWNFAGRQNDTEGFGGLMNGNWISGINFIDNARLGPQENIPDVYKHNKSRNKYYMLPLLLGVVGLLYQYGKNKRDFLVIHLLFFFTGLAIVLYLNQTPYQPRERDYAYVGSFYAFAIWIGLGVVAIGHFLKKLLSGLPWPGIISGVAATVLCTLLVPVIMGSQNWDDHDRSGRYTCRDLAANYLMTCKPNAILFTYGDNDTFPLWYDQEVEGIRTDVRVVNLSLLSTDWYIDQMKKKAYESDPLPITMNFDQYVQGTRDQIYLYERRKDTVDLGQVLDFIGSDNPKAQLQMSEDISFNYSPTKNLSLKVDKEKVLSNGTVSSALKNEILPELKWHLGKSSILKGDMIVLDILRTNKWERPVYFAVSAGPESYLGLDEFFQLEGFAYRLVPVKTPARGNESGRIDTRILYDNLMNKFKWGRMNEKDVYMDENNLRTLNIIDVKSIFGRLGEALVQEGKIDSAIKVCDRAVELMPNSRIPYDYYFIPVMRTYFLAKAYDKADEIVKILAGRYGDELGYYASLNADMIQYVDREVRIAKQVIQVCISYTDMFKQDSLNKELKEKYQRYFSESSQAKGKK
ncbi:MAG: DUF2723 domain-containing protein [Bacteroidia bacterium]|nr:DUF2723 domain-containing protein [Bacteroidia bacterium]